MDNIAEPDSAEPDEPATRSQPIRLSAHALKLTNAAYSIEMQELEGIGYASHFMAQASLPLSEPTGPFYTRVNGKMKMTITPAILDVDGVMTACYPYGAYPRLALIWIISEALRNDNPRVYLGSTINEFMTKLGLTGGGGTRVKEIRRQLLALFGCSLSVSSTENIGGRKRDRLLKMSIASEAEMWTESTEPQVPGQATLFDSWVLLSPEFFAKLKANGAVPLDARAVNALSNNAFALDIYTWATWRVYAARGADVAIPWALLHKQFGTSYKLTRQFKAAFLRNLEGRVKLVYPGLQFSSTADRLTLHKGSLPAVSQRVRPKRLK